MGVDGDWSQYRRDKRHSGRRAALSDGEPTGLNAEWTVDCPGTPGSVIVDRGAVYVGTDRGRLLSVDAKTGSRRFHLETDETILTPVATADRIVFATVGGTVVAVDPLSGEQIWTQSVDPLDASTSLILADQTLLVGTTSGLVALVLETGDLLWQWDGTAAEPAESVELAESDSELEELTASAPKELIASDLGAESETERNDETEPAIVGAPAACDDRVYAGTTAQTVVAVDRETGAEQWTVPTDGTIVGGPTVDGDRVYVADDDGTLLALDAETGQSWFTYEPNTTFTTPPTIVGDAAFVGGADSYLHIIDTEFGNRKLRGLLFSKKGIALDGIPRGSPVVTGDTLLIGDTNRWLYSIDVTDDDFTWHVRTDGALAGTPAITDDGLFVGDEDGHLTRLTWRHDPRPH